MELSALAQGNLAFRNNDYETAIHHYTRAQFANPVMAHMLRKNIELAYQRLGSQKVVESGQKVFRVDVVVPVYNALEDVKKCLASLQRCTDQFDVKVIVVNDGSDEPTTRWLREYCSEPIFKLIEQPRNLGYTIAINTGLKASTADYTITQNSDTIVSPGWLKGLIQCMNSSPKIGIVGPLSNAASWQNVPNLRDEQGNFAVNDLPAGFSVEDMARAVQQASTKAYPRLPFVNGFCFMIKREVIDAIGYMDEENFPVGYGEENDYCIRAIDAGFELAIADDVYVFHAKSKSFGHERRKVLSEQGTDSLKLKHTPEKYAARVAEVKRSTVLNTVRERIQLATKPRVLSGAVDFMKIRVLFLLPVAGGGGGAHSVVQEANAMRSLGVHVRIAVQKEHLERYASAYADIPDATGIFVGFDDVSLIRICSEFDVLVGTIYSSVALVKRIVDRLPALMPAYYVQDYEPLFFDPGSPRWQQAYDSYGLIQGACLFAKTHWIIDQVQKNHGVKVHKVSPSIDHTLYRPRIRQGDGKIHLAAMVRPQTPIRGAERTMRLLSRLHRVYGDRMAIHVFGCPAADPAFANLVQDFAFSNHGELSRPQVADLLSESDLFLDLSDYQAFGRTAAEAMACGCAVVVPLLGGANEYAVNGRNALVVDSQNEEACWDAVSNLLSNSEELLTMRAEGLLTASKYSAHHAAISELLVMHSALKKWREGKRVRLHGERIKLFANPSRDRHGAPLGSGFVRIVLPYQTANVMQDFDVFMVDKLPRPEVNAIVIVQRQVPTEKFDVLKAWIKECKRVGMKIVHDVDDDLLDANALRERGYSGDVQAGVIDKVKLMVETADLVLASTEPLAEKLRKFNGNVLVAPNGLDADLWQLHSRRIHTGGDFVKAIGDPVRIGYIGTQTHDADLKLIASAMRIIEKRFGNRVRIEVIGGFESSTPLFGERVPLPRKKDYPNFVRWLQQRVHWDIGLIPLVDDGFNQSKSYLKFLECAALDMALLVSDVPSYRPVAHHGVNCLVAKPTTEDWVEKLSKLIDDENLRKRLAHEAWTETASKHTLENIAPEIVAKLKALIP